MFEGLIGNEKAKRVLCRLVENGGRGGSLLFKGPAGVGKGLFARAFAGELLSAHDPEGSHRRKVESGVHPDLHLFSPEGKAALHSIDAMRQLSREVFMAPSEAKRKIFIIDDADRMVSFGANALLKTLEEPSLDALIILITSDALALLPTIRSRARTLFFGPVDKEEIAGLLMGRGVPGEEASRFAIQARGSVAEALQLATSGPLRGRAPLLALLARGSSSFSDIVRLSSEISEELGERRESIEKEARLSWTNLDQFSATARDEIEKEIEGAGSQAFAAEVDALLLDCLYWIRDCHLLRVAGGERFIYHREHRTELASLAEGSRLLSLRQASVAIQEARLAIQRSTRVSSVFEALLLQLCA